MLTHENAAREMGHAVIAGVDEAGRGPLAGPVAAAAVIFPDGVKMDGLTDSKKLTREKREKFFDLIFEKAVAVGFHLVGPDVIDSINILQATKLAMADAVRKLSSRPDYVLIDGNQTIPWDGPQKTIVKGDSLSLSIAAASVIAKVTRDKVMGEYAAMYPEYGFEKHKGYGVAEHLDAIKKYGPSPIHRRTFRGVKEFCDIGGEPAGALPQLELPGQ
ncbi:MAG: ribonuclease HII [Nitrospinae bacterium]|nr:ribonuclease HII [Nitrospinota bacterium]